MRQKPGLHKKISSIFDGVPLPKNVQQQAPDAELEQSADAAPDNGINQTQNQPDQGYQQPAPVSPQAPSPSQTNTPAPAPRPDPAPRPAPSPRPATTPGPAPEYKPAPKQDQNSMYSPKPAPAPAAKPPAPPKPKPQPAQKTKTTLTKTTLSKQQSPLLGKIKSFLESMQDGTEEARQKKMAVLVGLLAVVMAIVLFSVLHEPKKSKANPKTDTTTQNTNQARPSKITWTAPEVYPDNLRDPMRYTPATTTDPTTTQMDQLVVTGIVFSETNPSAIISGSIVNEGEQVMGVTVVKINKETIEFEKDGKTWTQPVQR